ncbi:MAG: tetratricopeptide repeat protein [Pirellulales bacterium]
MLRPILLVRTIALVALAGAGSLALAQADAKKAYDDGKAAYQAGQYAQARDLLTAAAQTDPKNPEVFLLLGKAQYQLGAVDQAMAAWTQTLALAPEEPYAGQMLKVLRGQAADVETRLKLVELMLPENLPQPALMECSKLLTEKAPSDAQRAKAMLLKAAAQLKQAPPAEALKTVQEVLTLYPAADPAQTALLAGQAKVRLGGEKLAEGLALLKKVVAEHAKTPAAATASYELILFDLTQSPGDAGIKALSAWIAANPGHASQLEARSRLVESCLAATRRTGPPAAGAGVSGTDASAVAAAGELYPRYARAEDALALTTQLLNHVETHYAQRGAHAAATSAAESILALPLPPTSRLAVLRALGRYRAELVLKQLGEAAKAGRLAAGPLPKGLADAAAAYATIDAEFPAEPAWKDQAALAERVQQLAAVVPWPPVVTQLRAPSAWAVEIALPVVKADADAAAVASALALVTNIGNECAQVNQPAAQAAALNLQAQLVAALSSSHAGWPAAVLRQVDLLNVAAVAAFNDEVKAGKPEENAKLSARQSELLAALAGLVVRDVAQAPAAVQKLGEHLQLWIANGHYAAAEEAYNALEKSLPEAQQRQVRLAVVGLWVQEVTKEHERLAAAGQVVPRKLDPRLAKAAERCCVLQAGLAQTDPFLAQTRGVLDGIVNIYQALEYYDLAEQVIAIKPAEAADTANAYAALQLANLRAGQAQRELDALLKRYKGTEQITLTPAFRAAIDAYAKLAADRPTDPLAGQAIQGIFGIAQVFEQRQSFDVAAGVYRELAALAAKSKILSQSSPGASSTAERAAFAAVAALDAKARKALEKATAARKPNDPPPAKISDEFAAAVGAYKAFIKANPSSALVGQAVQKIMAVALVYAKADAWTVADGVYADLLASGLVTRQPERIEFCRGLCQLGAAMPEHAKQVLSALGEGPAKPASGGETALAGMGFGGRGGGAGGRITVGVGVASDAGLIGPLAPAGAVPGGGPVGASRPADSKPASVAGTVTASPAAEAPPVQVQLKADELADAVRDADVLTTIRQQEASRASQVAMLRENVSYRYAVANQQQPQADQMKVPQQQAVVMPPVLSEAEVARLDKALGAAYAVFQSIRKSYPTTSTAEQARGEVLVMVSHWRSLAEWRRAAALAQQYLADNPADIELPRLRLEIARDELAWAAKPIPSQPSKQAMLAEVSDRFAKARAELTRIVADFPDEKASLQGAQWDIANSYLTQARAVNAFSPTLARGQYVRAAKELENVADTYYDHPEIAKIPDMLWSISQELESRTYFDEALILWNDLAIRYVGHPLTQQALLKVAQVYQNNLQRPLRAAEAYQELNFAKGGADQAMQDAIYQIGVQLKDQKRWVEALHVLEIFVDSFPSHPQAGQALTIIGQIHQTNGAWEDAIAAYRRVIAEFRTGQWVQEAEWSIAECTINLSQWKEAIASYQAYVAAYPQDPKVAEANNRVEILKDLARYQVLVDEKGQRKAFDAQYQIAAIVRTKLANPVKAIIEYRKVKANWPESHLADDALYDVGTTYLSLGETEKAREALLVLAKEYPASPLADDALFMVGKSYEDEAQKLAGATREKTLEEAKDVAQRWAYEQSQSGRRQNRETKLGKVAGLKAAGQNAAAEQAEASVAANYGQFNDTNVRLFAEQALQVVESLTATQLADRQDKINAALRKAVASYTDASKVPAADKAGDALLRMATIYDENLKDAKAAMDTWLEIVRQFSGTAVAEDASWRIAQYYERAGEYDKAIEAYKGFLRNYRRSAKAGAAQFAVAEDYEHLNQWVAAMDSYTNYLTNFPDGPLAAKAQQQINWIKTYRL